ncbi:MAG: hypothetical protein JO013_04900 [Alphaproteobacteria bacterium]|nr:hypothetical protein [Alphaproteobacteria bacterium]
MTVDSAPPVLRLRIETDESLRAELVARAIERLSVGFNVYQREHRHPGHAKLRIEDLHTGSVIADLKAIGDAIGTLYDLRESLLGFVGQLVDGLQWIMSFEKSPSKPPSTVKRTIEAVAAPVANDHASQVTVQVIGDNNLVLMITKDMIPLLQEGLHPASHKVRKSSSPKARSRRAVDRQAPRQFGKSLARDAMIAGIIDEEQTRPATAVTGPDDADWRDWPWMSGIVIRRGGEWQVLLDGESETFPLIMKLEYLERDLEDRARFNLQTRGPNRDVRGAVVVAAGRKVKTGEILGKL